MTSPSESQLNDPSHGADHSATSAIALWRDRFAAALEYLVTALLLATVLMTVFQVGLRFSTGRSVTVLDELSRWLFVWMVFLGVPASVARDEALQIDFISPVLGARGKALHNSFVNSIVSLTAVLMMFHGTDVVSRSVFRSPALQWPNSILESSIPVAGALILLGVFFNQASLGRGLAKSILPILVGAVVFAAVRYSITTFEIGITSTTIVLVAALALVLLAVPIGFAVICGSFLAMQVQGDIMVGVVTQTLTSSIDSFLLLAIPFFILAAGIMNAGGITKRLVSLAVALVGHLRGGLGYVNVVTNTLMAGVSASSFADAAAVSKILGKPMTDLGYPKGFTAALTGASAITANLIPPSLALILYGALANVSVGDLFVAGIIPGLLMALTLATVVRVQSKRFGFDEASTKAKTHQTWTAFKAAVPALIVPFGVVGGLRAGFFTTTEAGAIAVVYATLIGMIAYREFPFHKFLPILRESAIQVSSILFLVSASGPLSWILVSAQAPQKLASLVSIMTDNAVYVLLLVNAVLMFIGLFIEVVAAMIVLVPLLLPIVVAIGMDPIHFGIVIVVNLMLGSLTPPMGIMAFITARVIDVPVTQVFRASIPFLFGLTILLLILTFIPQISLFLPTLLGG